MEQNTKKTANMSVIEAKKQRVAELAELIKKAQSVVVCDYRGLTVLEDTAMRKEMRENGVEYMVLKNNLMLRAAKEAGIDDSFGEFLKGPSAFAFGMNDPVAPAKVLKNNFKAVKKGELKGGIMDGKVIDAQTVQAIADLPSREELLGRMVGSMKSPISKLAIALQAVADQKGEGTAAQEG